MRVVLDTLAAIRSEKGASRRLVVAGLERRLSILVSVPLMIEYQAVLTRPEHLTAARLRPASIGRLLDAVAATAEPIHLSYLWRPMLRDPDDDMVLETAVNGRAEAIVTLNPRDFGEARRFGVDVLSSGQAWARMEPGK